METLAHNNLYSFVADNRVRDGVHGIDGRIELYQNSHPVIFVESGGHGIYGTRSSHARYDIAADRFTAGAGVTYVYKGVAERPRHANDRNVGYQLLPIYNFWWLRTPAGDRTRTFDAYYTYVPAGNRPNAALDPIGGSFRGRYAGVNKAKPFWGWHDIRTRKQGIVATGQWGLDPAYAVSRNLTFPQPFSTTYTFNPYLAVNGARTNARLPAPAFGKPVKSKVYRAALRRTEAPVNPAPASPAAPSAPIAPSAPEPALDLTPDLPEFNSGIIEFRLRVDGSVEVSLQGNSLTLNTLSGSPAVNPAFDASQYLPRFLFRSVKVYLRQGRGKARVIERPTAANGYTLRLRIDDPKRGPDDYHVLIEWRR